jgi:hypothetical protein
MKTLSITIRFHCTYLLLSLLFGCNSVEKRWEVINQSDSIPSYLSFYETFPDNIYGDSALLKVEHEIFLRSYQSTSRNETFINYEKFIQKYPRINDITEADKKLNLLKQKADTIEVSGKLVSKESVRFSSVNITILPVSDDGKAHFFFDEGIFQNPSVYPDSLGNFKFVFHESVLKNMPFITLEFSMGFLGKSYMKDEKGIPIQIKIDNTTRIFNIGDIQFSMK